VTFWHNQIKKEKNRLVPDAEIPAAEIILREKFAGRAETANLSHIRCRGRFRIRRRVRWAGIFPENDASGFTPKQPFLSHITITANILSDLPSKRVY
jgi:hypothetical protein